MADNNGSHSGAEDRWFESSRAYHLIRIHPFSGEYELIKLDMGDL